MRLCERLLRVSQVLTPSLQNEGGGVQVVGAGVGVGVAAPVYCHGDGGGGGDGDGGGGGRGDGGGGGWHFVVSKSAVHVRDIPLFQVKVPGFQKRP